MKFFQCRHFIKCKIHDASQLCLAGKTQPTKKLGFIPWMHQLFWLYSQGIDSISNLIHHIYSRTLAYNCEMNTIFPNEYESIVRSFTTHRVTVYLSVPTLVSTYSWCPSILIDRNSFTLKYVVVRTINYMFIL